MFKVKYCGFLLSKIEFLFQKTLPDKIIYGKFHIGFHNLCNLFPPTFPIVSTNIWQSCHYKQITSRELLHVERKENRAVQIL